MQQRHRNLGNCLWDEEKQQLIPIDHGCSLLDSADWRPDNPEPISEMYSLLAFLPQLEQPLAEDLNKWAQSLDADQTAQDLRTRLNIPESSINELKMRWMVLQKGLEKGLTLDKILPMLMLKNEECLLEVCSREAGQKAQLHEREWASLTPKEAASKRFDIFFNYFKQSVEKYLTQ